MLNRGQKGSGAERCWVSQLADMKTVCRVKDMDG